MQIVSSSSSSRSARIERSDPVSPAAHKGCGDTAASERSDTPPPGNPLVAAMTQALQSLVPGRATQAAGATTTGDPTAATTTATTTVAPPTSTAPDLKDAAIAFAHELFQALRSGASSHTASERSRSEGHGHHHHHDRYGNLAQRLDRLASQLTNPPATETATTGSTTAAPAAASTPAATRTNASPATTGPGADAPAATTSTPATASNPATPTAPAAAPTESPLLAAFGKLFEALQPSAAAHTASPDVRAALATFLHTMAQALGAGGEPTQPASAAVNSGGLVHVTA